MTNNQLKALFYELFDAQYLDSIYCQSADSILATIGMDIIQTSCGCSVMRSVGGFSRVENNSILSYLNSVYRSLPPNYQNLLKEHIYKDLTYNELSDLSRQFFNKQFSPFQIRELFRRKIYPLLHEKLADLPI